MSYAFILIRDGLTGRIEVGFATQDAAEDAAREVMADAPPGIPYDHAEITCDRVKINTVYAHDLYTDADKDRPPIICDSNGQVVLGLCKRCGKGEAELFGRYGGPSACDPLPTVINGCTIAASINRSNS